MAATGYTPISLYYSTTAAAQPTNTNLVNGELAINITDGKLYYKDNSGTVQLLASKATTAGSVIGPSSATDNAIVRFDLTTGKLVQNSSVTIDDSGNISGVNSLSASGSVTLSGGVANGIAYLNGSKVLTSGNGLVFVNSNLLIGGTATRNTTTGTAHIDIFNGTEPAGTLTNGISLYSSSGDFLFMDSAGNSYKTGYRNLPPIGTKSTSYTLTTSDVGKYVQVGSGGSITIPNATFSEGDALVVFNNTSGNITITCSITTAYVSGTDVDRSSMTLATRGVANILFIDSTTCVVTGNVS